MLELYLPILVFVVVALLFGGVALAASLGIGRVLKISAPSTDKNAPYECGFAPFDDARVKFNVRYYLIAILFIIFDLEIAFMFPWAVALDNIGMPGFVAMLVFLGVLVVGFVYEWKKGALEWE